MDRRFLIGALPGGSLKTWSLRFKEQIGIDEIEHNTETVFMRDDPVWLRWNPSDINQSISVVDANAATTPVTVSINIFGESIIQDLELPRGPSRPSDLLPDARSAPERSFQVIGARVEDHSADLAPGAARGLE